MSSSSRNQLFATLYDSTLLFLRRTGPQGLSTPRTPLASSFSTLSRPRHFPSPSPFAPFYSIAAGAARTPRSRYVVSRGFAGFCAWTTVPTASSPATASTAVTESAVCSGNRAFTSPVLDRRRGWGKVWVRAVHTARRRRNIERPKKLVKRNISATRNMKQSSGSSGNNNSNEKASSGNKPSSEKQAESHNVLSRISHIHRPTKDAMLAAATGFWKRLSIRTKWSLIRQMRPYNWEDISAFFSWLFIGHVIWVVVGTTTFMSLAIFLVNSVFAQEYLAGAVGNYLTKETGLKVVFESAIVPRWGDGCISFKNVFVSRRPGQQKKDKRNVRKGSPTTAAAAAAAAKQADAEAGKEVIEAVVEEEDTNYTQFDVTIDTVNVTLSFARWMNGKGLLTDVEIKGVRGVIDRTHVHWVGDIDPRSQRREHHPGDFEIESFKMEDLLVTIHQPGGFRPFTVSIYSCDLPQLRKQWLFYDFLSANNMSGSFDDSLFTIHPRQTQTNNFTSEMLNGAEADSTPSPWKKTSRLRIDGLDIEHLNRGVEGPFSWIQSGNVDIVADVMFPADEDLALTKVVQDIVERMEATVSSRAAQAGLTQPSLASNPTASEREKHSKFVVMDLHVQLNEPRAAVPLFTSDLSYVNNALIRPIVAYINSRKTYIPINCRVVKRLDEFDGSWTIFDSGLMDDLSAETYDAFAKDVTDDQARRRRIKKVGLWSLQLAMQAILMAMAGSVA